MATHRGGNKRKRMATIDEMHQSTKKENIVETKVGSPDVSASKINPCKETTFAIRTLEKATTDIGRRLGDAEHECRLVAAADNRRSTVIDRRHTGSSGSSSDSDRVIDARFGPFEKVAIVDIGSALVDEAVGAAVKRATKVMTGTRHCQQDRWLIAFAVGTIWRRFASLFRRCFARPERDTL